MDASYDSRVDSVLIWSQESGGEKMLMPIECACRQHVNVDLASETIFVLCATYESCIARTNARIKELNLI